MFNHQHTLNSLRLLEACIWFIYMYMYIMYMHVHMHNVYNSFSFLLFLFFFFFFVGPYKEKREIIWISEFNNNDILYHDQQECIEMEAKNTCALSWRVHIKDCLHFYLRIMSSNQENPVSFLQCFFSRRDACPPFLFIIRDD